MATGKMDKEMKMEVWVELEKLSQVNFILLWNYLNFEINKVSSVEDENFVRAGDFHENIAKLLKEKNSLKKEIIEG